MKFEKRKQIFFSAFMIIYAIAILIPVVFIISASFSDEKQLAIQGYGLLPRQFSLEAYKFLLENGITMLRAAGLTLLVGVCSIFWSLTQQVAVAYVLTKQDFKWKRAISFYLYFTSLFGGGIVASYILITQYLHLNNTIFVYFVGPVGAMSVFIIRTNLQKIPYEVQESAYMDGASEYTILLRIIVPMSKAVLGYYAFECMAGAWNNYITPLYYITDRKLHNIQYLLHRTFMSATVVSEMPAGAGAALMKDLPVETARMAMAVLVMIPTIACFPYFQKYMVKGLAVGSVKG